MIQIDGAKGEGGGQILRTSLAMSMATGRPFRIVNIRAARPKPGLMRQHLTCVLAAAEICGAQVTGASVGSAIVEFSPGKPKAGEYVFRIGTAGGTMLVLQAVLPALLRVEGRSTIRVEGGTHAKAAPPFEFFERCLMPLLNRCGARVRARLERRGFYPAGGGSVFIEVEPSSGVKPLELLERGEFRGSRATVILSRLPHEIADRELAVLRGRLSLDESGLQVVHVEQAVGPGNALAVEYEYEHLTEVFSAMGEPGRRAESVAEEAANAVRSYLRGGRPVGPHLADQLMTPLCLLAGGRYATGPLTEHSRTNIDVLRQFGGVVAASDDGVIEVASVVT